uniref:NADH-ubiquinone oxidoreductase chain 4L n=1 Tax=Scydmaeninae sp. BMNH 1274313 TaxID=1796549 RepID=A0A126TFA9_9COLE|nr:NADH dehydrogenase subunit 4L [Scydmaeninae sp. BMNH 1274313]
MLFLISNLSLCMNRKHILLMLLSLEFMMLSLFLNLFIYIMNFMNSYFFLMVYMVIMVCEGVLGLSLLVFMMRTHGNDYFKTLSILW